MSKQLILDEAVLLAQRVGYRNLTRRELAAKAKLATGTISYHFGTMTDLRTAIMKEAIKRRYFVIIRQGLVDGNEHVKRAPLALRKEAANFFNA